MREVVVATANKGKLKELELILCGVVESIRSLADFSGIPPVVEDRATFAENALKKARSAAAATRKPVIADDSGLVVDALHGAPGVYSARFAGEGAGDADNNMKLLAMMDGVPAQERQAAFHCVIALSLPDGTCRTFSGELKGVILTEMRGAGGFGYDPLFLVPEYGKTLAELPMEVKNRISHRAAALGKLIDFLATFPE